jgi:putative Holliday junction resolvase
MPERQMPRRLRSPPPPPSRVSASADHGTVLAFDFGERRTGVAVGDARLGTAHPLTPIAGGVAGRLAAIAGLVEEWRPRQLVVGLPVATDGGEHPLAVRVERFARQLEGRFGLPVARVDERYTSAEAQSRVREAAGARRAAKASRARELDSYAAQLILEQYFDERLA